MWDSKFSLLGILIGEEVLLSTPAKIALSSLKPGIFLSKLGRASLIEVVILLGNSFVKSES